MVLPIDKTAKSFNVSAIKLNHKYAGDYKKLTQQSIEDKQKTKDLQRTLYLESNTPKTHDNASYWINILQEEIRYYVEH